MERFRKLFQLSPTEALILVQAWLVFLAVELALRLVPFTYLLAFCNRNNPKTKPASALEPSVPRMAWLVEVAGRYSTTAATCLKQALVLSWLLRRSGVRTILQIGVAQDNTALSFHAWLEHDGCTIVGHSGSSGHVPLLPDK